VNAPQRIDGVTKLIAHLGYPTSSFTAPKIFNPYFAAIGENALVVPMGVPEEARAAALPAIFGLTNLIGALITMPHKVAVLDYLDVISDTVRVAGACNAVRRASDGRLFGDMFDGEGFVRGLVGKGVTIAGSRALIVGAGGVGSAIAASLAKAGVGALTLAETRAGVAEALAARLAAVYPSVAVTTGQANPTGHAIVVNATALGMAADDARPFDLSRLEPGMVVGEVVLKPAVTPLIAAARDRGCVVQPGVDMLFEQIPAYLDFFGLPAASAERLRELARL
jgi:shikimate dehydrogenase